MAQESRVKKSILNARVNLLFYFLILALSFFSRKIFLDTLGADFIGLTGTIGNLLGYLNLAELGIATAIGYILYKPLLEQNHLKINEVVSVLGFLYRRIGLVIIVLGIGLSFFLPLIFPNTGFDLPLIYFAYFSFLTSSLIGYFCNYKQTLLGADQRNYVITGYYQGINILKVLIQLSAAWYTRNYFLWVSIELLFGIIYSFVLNHRIKRTYPWLQPEIKRGKELLKTYPEVWKYTKQLFIQKLSGTVQWWTVPFLTYTFASLQMVAYYGNYTIITDKISQLSSTFLDSTNAGVGNLIAEGNKNNIQSVFWQLIYFRYFIGSVFCFCIYWLINPFIALWLGQQFVLPDIVVILICINLLISSTRGGVMQFVYGYGLFADVWAAIAEVVLNLGIACICGHFWGLPGVLLGGITSQILIVNIWKPYYLYSKGFKANVISYYVHILKLIILISLSISTFLTLRYLIYSPNDWTWFIWIKSAFVTFIVYTSITFLLFYLCSHYFRKFVHRFIKTCSTN